MAWTPPASDAVSAWTPPESDAVERKFTYQPPFTPAPKSWLQQAGEDFVSPMSGAWQSLKKDAAASVNSPSELDRFASTGKAALDVLGLATSPVAGAYNAAVARPVGEGLARIPGVQLPGQTQGEAVSDAMGAVNQAASAARPGAAGTTLNAMRYGNWVRPAATTTAEIAHDAGYVLPPAMATDKPGTLGSVLSAWGGKIKTAQAASTKNQAVTNALAASDLGLPKDTMLTERAFEQARKPALDAYKAVENAGVPIKQDDQFFDDLLKLGPNSEEMAKYFPKTARNDLIKEMQDELGTGQTFSPKAGIQAVRRLRYKASANLKDFANPDKVELGMAQRKAADALDDLIERNLSDAGKPDLVKDYRQARQLLAKSHDLESATNTATGDVDARALARLANKGRPLSGNSKIIADTANTFPKAMQSPARFGGDEKFSAVDAYAALMAGAQGRMDVLGAIAGRPLAREIALSRVMQNRLAAPKPVPPNSLAAILRPTQQIAQPIVPTYGP